MARHSQHTLSQDLGRRSIVPSVVSDESEISPEIRFYNFNDIIRAAKTEFDAYTKYTGDRSLSQAVAPPLTQLYFLVSLVFSHFSCPDRLPPNSCARVRTWRIRKSKNHIPTAPTKDRGWREKGSATNNGSKESLSTHETISALVDQLLRTALNANEREVFPAALVGLVALGIAALRKLHLHCSSGLQLTATSLQTSRRSGAYVMPTAVASERRRATLMASTAPLASALIMMAAIAAHGTAVGDNVHNINGLGGVLFLFQVDPPHRF